MRAKWTTTERGGNISLWANGGELTSDQCIRLAATLLGHADWQRSARERAKAMKKEGLEPAWV